MARTQDDKKHSGEITPQEQPQAASKKQFVKLCKLNPVAGIPITRGIVFRLKDGAEYHINAFEHTVVKVEHLEELKDLVKQENRKISEE